MSIKEQHPNDILPFEHGQTDDIQFVERVCWRMLAKAVTDRNCPMHNLVLGTSDGVLANMRTVISRKVDEDRKRIYFHTDIRSHKIREIQAAGMVSLLAYHPGYRSQIRINGPSVLHHQDDLCQLHWQETKHFSRRCYLFPEGPGQQLHSPLDAIDEKLASFSYTMEESEAGYRHFVVVETEASLLEWYYTHSQGNRRAAFRYDGGTLKDAQWLTP